MNANPIYKEIQEEERIWWNNIKSKVWHMKNLSGAVQLSVGYYQVKKNKISRLEKKHVSKMGL